MLFLCLGLLGVASANYCAPFCLAEGLYATPLQCDYFGFNCTMECCMDFTALPTQWFEAYFDSYFPQTHACKATQVEQFRYITNTSSFSSFNYGFMQWDLPTVPNGTIFSQCPVKTGTPISIGNSTWMPFMYPSQVNGVSCGVDLCTGELTALTCGFSNSVVSRREDFRVSTDATADFVADYTAIMNIFNDSMSLAGVRGSLNESAPFSICQLQNVQCLSFPNETAIDVNDPDFQWAVKHEFPTSSIPTTPKAVDYLTGKATHYAFLMTPDLVGQNTSVVDMSLLKRCIFISGMLYGNFTFTPPPSLRGFDARGNFSFPPNTVLPNVTLFHGSVMPGAKLPTMPNVVDLRLLAPSLTEVELPRRTDNSISCATLIARTLKAGTSCDFCSPNSTDYNLSTSSFSNLQSLSLIGFTADLWNPWFSQKNLSSLKTLTIMGSLMTQFVSPPSLTTLTLQHNTYLTNVSVGSSVTNLTILGSLQLGPLKFPAALRQLDLSYSHGVSLLPCQSNNNATFPAISQFRCEYCGFTSFPDLTCMPAVTHVLLAFNPIKHTIRELLALPSWSTYLQRLCYLDMSYNAIDGPFPNFTQVNSFLPSGANCANTSRMIFDGNMIESFESPVFPFNDATLMQGLDINAYFASFKMFPVLPPNFDAVVSLRYNRLKGRIPDDSPWIVNAHLSALEGNDYYCQTNDYLCYQLPILFVGVTYGSSSSLDLQMKARSPFLPFAFSGRDTQRIEYMIYNCTDIFIRVMDGQFQDMTTNQIMSAPVDVTKASSYNRDSSVLRISWDTSSNPLDTPKYFMYQRQLFSTCNTRPVFVVDSCMRGRGVGKSGLCDNCPARTFGATSAQEFSTGADILLAAITGSACTSCPTVQDMSTVTLQVGSASVLDCVCPAGSFGKGASIVNGTITAACSTCSEAMKCSDPNTTVPAVASGFVFDSVSQSFLRCDPLKACENGMCTDGYVATITNPACSKCADRYYRVNHECHPCLAYSQLILLVCALLFAIGLLWMLRNSKADLSQLFALSIAMGYMQIVSVYAAFPVDWPEQLHSLLNVLSVFNFNLDLTAPECSVKTSFWIKWLMQILLPLYVAGALGLLYLFVRLPCVKPRYITLMTREFRCFRDRGLVSRCLAFVLIGKEARQTMAARKSIVDESMVEKEEEKRQQELLHFNQRFLTTMVNLMVVGYLFLAKSSTQPFNCAKLLVDGKVTYHIRSDPSQSCYDATWYAWQPLAIIAILVYAFGIPIIIGCILFHGKRKQLFRDERWMAYFGGFIIPYRVQYWYWALVLLARKLVIVLLLDFLSADDSVLQISVFFAALTCFFFVQEFLRPYEFTWCNRLEFTWLGYTLLVLLAALVFSFPDALDKSQKNIYSVSLVIGLVAALVVTIYTFVLEKRRMILKEGLGITSVDTIAAEHQVLEHVFGANLGHNIHRKMRVLSPEKRERFVARVSSLTNVNGKSAAKQPLLGKTTDSANPETLPSAAADRESNNDKFSTDAGPDTMYQVYSNKSEPAQPTYATVDSNNRTSTSSAHSAVPINSTPQYVPENASPTNQSSSSSHYTAVIGSTPQYTPDTDTRTSATSTTTTPSPTLYSTATAPSHYTPEPAAATHYSTEATPATTSHYSAAVTPNPTNIYSTEATPAATHYSTAATPATTEAATPAQTHYSNATSPAPTHYTTEATPAQTHYTTEPTPAGGASPAPTLYSTEETPAATHYSAATSEAPASHYSSVTAPAPSHNSNATTPATHYSTEPTPTAAPPTETKAAPDVEMPAPPAEEATPSPAPAAAAVSTAAEDRAPPPPPPEDEIV